MFEEFKDKMERKFIKESKKHEDSWETVPLYRLRRFLKEHVDKWLNNHNSRSKSSIEQEKKDLIDVANYCCMVYNRLD